MGKTLPPEARKISHTVQLSPRQTNYAVTEARRMQMSLPSYIRHLIEREIERTEGQTLTERLQYRV